MAGNVNQFFATRGNKIENNIQQIVRAVVANLNTLPPQQPPQNGSNINGNPTSNVHGNLTVQDELYRSFQIPRTSTSGNTNQAVAQTSQSARQSEQLQGSISNQASIVNSIAAGFSSTSNYSNTRGTTRSRRTNRSNNTGRFQPYSHSCSSTSSEEPKIYYKSVCFLPDSTWDSVPRGRAKVELIERGMFVDAWAVKKNWSEKKLNNEVVKLCKSLWPNGDSESFE